MFNGWGDGDYKLEVFKWGEFC